MAPKPRPKKAAPAAAEPRPPEPIETALLVTRRQAGRLLGVSSSTLIRMESQGVLKALKLVPNARAQTFYRKHDVIAVAERGAADV